MRNPSNDKTRQQNDKSDKATIDHLVEEMYEDRVEEGRVQSPTTDNGLPVEGQVRKEWGPKKGGLPIF